MKNNRRDIERRVLTVFLSLVLAFSILTFQTPIVFAEEATQTGQPESTETPQPAEPETSETQPATETTDASDGLEESDGLDEPQIIEVDGAECVAGEVIVKFKDATSDTAAQYTLESMDSQIQELPTDDLIVTEVPEGETVEGFINTLESQPNVEYAQPNYAYAMEMTVDDPGTSNQWYLNKIGAYDAWNITMGSPNVKVAVIDSGIDLDHVEFSGQIYAQTDVVDDDGSADNDTDSHGTHVAGIIAARADNGVGIAGIAPGVQLIIADVFDGEYAYTSDVIEAIRFSVNNGADIINLSLGCNIYDLAFNQALDEATERGVVCVAAAGNSSTDAATYPSDFDSVISVIATTSTDTKADYSNYGSPKDISAPGSGIYSTNAGGGYIWMSGTSMAAPVVSAVAALVLSENPDLTVGEVKNILFSTAVDLGSAGKDSIYGFGRVDAHAAVQAVQGEDALCDVTVVTSLQANTTSVTGSLYCTVSGGGKYTAGSTAALTATPKEGYRFVGWTSGSTQLSTDAAYLFTVSSSCTITAVFAAIGTPKVSASPTGYTSVQIAWTAVEGAAGYQLWRSTSADSGYSQVVTINSTGFADSGLSIGTTYYYKVRAYCAASTATTYGGFSAYTWVSPTSITAPSVRTAAANYSSITVSWSAIAGMKGYQIYRATSADGAYSLIKTTSALSFTNTKLATGTTYYYKVRGYSVSGKAKTYWDFSAAVSATPVLSAVATVTAAATSPTKAKVSWSAVAGRTGYEVWRSENGGAYTLIGSTTKTNFTSAGLMPFRTYAYYVRAYRTVGGQKIYAAVNSPVASVTPVLNNVTNVNIAITSVTKIKLSWGSVSGASGYEVLRWDETLGQYILIASTAKKYYTDVNLIPNRSYSYQVRAYCALGTMRVYSTASAPVSAMPVFGTVYGFKAVRSSATRVKLTWSAVSGRTGYEIYRATSAGGEYSLIGSTTKTSFNSSGLTTGTTYYYMIRAYVTVNGVRQYSGYSAVVIATP